MPPARESSGVPEALNPTMSLTLARPVVWLVRCVAALSAATARDFHHSWSWALLAVSDRHPRCDKLALALEKDSAERACGPDNLFGSILPPSLAAPEA